ncbi:MAG: FixH family protein [Vibrio sp.]|uniref:FixH family protein n=1 Tax=Vibrio chanodichtyis TaxID=3027932 RepID=A0ABT5V1H1_9VIBR|nr:MULTISPECIES: FixH family protein [Vibrio]MDE1514170.1 FixH family protein [Vibrio chanodichtyis]
MVTAWYKQFWPWFLIILPLSVVIWTLVTVMIFAHHPVSLVTEDYYKKGKAINLDLSKVKVAQALQLQATVYSQGTEVIIQLDKGQLSYFPALQALFAHRTLAERDFSKLLTADAKGVYRLKLDTELQGPWFIELTPHDQQWLIQGRVTFPASSTPLMN